MQGDGEVLLQEVCVCVCVRARAGICVCVHVCVCVWAVRLLPFLPFSSSSHLVFACVTRIVSEDDIMRGGGGSRGGGGEGAQALR